MAASFYRFLVRATVCVACSKSLCVTRNISKKAIISSSFDRIKKLINMPPKRKAVNTKAKPEEDVAAENGAAGDAPKSKKTKEVKAADDSKPKRGRAAKASKEEEDQPAPKGAKARGSKATEKTEQEERPKRGRVAKKETAVVDEPGESEDEEKTEVEEKPKRGRAAKQKVPIEDDATEEVDNEPVAKKSKPKTKKETKAKQSEPKKKSDAKPKKGRAAAKNKDDVAEEDDEPPKNSSKTLQNDTVTDYSKIDFSCTRKNANGNTFNLKIASWNVDGLRALVKKNGHVYVEKEDPDILCLQEIKCSEEQIPQEIKNLEEKYKSYWCSSEKDGYAGVALLSKIEPHSVKFGINDEKHDDEGRCITAEYEHFYLVNVYVPNAGRKLVTLPKRLEWNLAFQDYIKSLDYKKPVIICGDMNVSHKEIDLANPKTNKKNAGFTQEERDGMTDFLNTGYVDTYRKFYPDKPGVYTFWTYMMKSRSKNVGWRLDYFIVSDRFMDHICDNVVRSEVLGSDHCPITLFLHV